MFIFLALLVIVGYSCRDILQKHTASYYHHHYEAGGIPAIFTCLFMVIALFFLPSLWSPSQVHYQFYQPFWQMITQVKQQHVTTIIICWALLVAVIKGIIVFLFNSGARNLDLSSVSGGTYLAFISVALGGILNHCFFKENIAIVPIIIIFITALLFYLLGPGKRLIYDKKIKTLIFCIISLSTLICLDYIGIRASNWFFHLACSNTISLVLFLCLIRKRVITDFSFLANPMIILSGIVYAMMEFLFVYSFSILGVSYAFLFGMLSYLPTMLIGSIKYGEGKWYIQAIFAIIAVGCVYIMAFG